MSNEEPQSDSSSSGLGEDGTIPDTEDGIAVGHSPDATTFEPEEDAGADGEVAAARGDDAEKDKGTDADNDRDDDSDTRSGQNLDDTIDGAPGPLE